MTLCSWQDVKIELLITYIIVTVAQVRGMKMWRGCFMEVADRCLSYKYFVYVCVFFGTAKHIFNELIIMFQEKESENRNL